MWVAQFLDCMSQRFFKERKTALLAEMAAGHRSKTAVVAELRKLAARLFPRREIRVRQSARMLLRRVVAAETIPEGPERDEFLAMRRVVEDIAAGGSGAPRD
jgi:hypothetical protein